MKHTQGEWIMHNNVFNSVVITKIDSGYKVIGSFTNDNKLIPEEEMRANAKLCAAAPELLEALQKAVEVIERMSDEYSTIAGHHASYTNGESKIIEGAIKKATE